MGDRLPALLAASEAREDVEGDELTDGFEPTPRLLPAVALPEVIFPTTDAERARASLYCAGLDCETLLIQPGRQTPRLVVTGYQFVDGRQCAVTGDPTNALIHGQAFLAFTDSILQNVRALGGGEVIDVGSDSLTAQTPLAPKPTVYTSTRGLLVNQNLPFDFAVIAEEAHRVDASLGLVGQAGSWHDLVMRRIFEMLDRGLVEDTQLRERLLDIAEGTLEKDFSSLTAQGNPRKKGYDLKSQAKKYLGVELDKISWRTGYYRFLDKPIDEYPEGARDYLTLDVGAALQVHERQQRRAEQQGLASDARIPNSVEQSRAAWAFQLVSSWGMRTERGKVQAFDADLDHWSRRLFTVLKKCKLVRADGTRDIKLARKMAADAYEAAGLEVPLTKKKKDGSGGGNISLSGSTMEDISLIRLRGTAEGEIDEEKLGLFEEPLYAYSQYTSFDKLKTTHLPVLYSGVDYPVCGRFQTIVGNGRSSMFSPNLQSLPRGGVKTVLARLQARVRKCFVPRPGFVFCSVDFDTLELRTLAQVCLWLLGHSKLADALNAGMDPHLLMAAEQFLHITYEEAVARKKAGDKEVIALRQFCKPINFGAAGALGAQSYVDYAKSYGIYVTLEEARDALQKFRLQWPEMVPYFKRVASMMRGIDDDGNEIGDVEQFVSGRIRGRVRYTAVANGWWSGLAADGAKAALYEVCRECYLQGGRMYGARPGGFIHDEILTELPEDVAHEYAHVQRDIMVEVMQAHVPDVKIHASPVLMRCWQKGAEAVYDKRGRLIPWIPEAASV
jgi:hypothetical protein